MAKQKKVVVNPDEAFARHQKIAEREHLRRKLFLENVIDIVEQFETQGYKAILGEGVPQVWAGYLGQIEIFYSRAQVERWRKVVSFLKARSIPLEKVVDIPESRLEDIVRLEPDSVDFEQIAEQAKQVSSQEWKDVVAEYSGKPSSYDCEHKLKIYSICTKCGDKHRIDAGQDESKDAEIQ